MNPVLKWAGGKRRLVPELLKRLPRQFGTYHEPFFGGGALFFALPHSYQYDAMLSDASWSLINFYRALAKDSLWVQREAVKLLEWYREDPETRYREVRERFNKARMEAEPCFEPRLAPSFLILNRTCFNGLWRTNRRGEFNVPHGKYKNPTVPDLAAAGAALARTDIQHLSYEEAFDAVLPGDFVYCDPPYATPEGGRTTYTNYSVPFGWVDQVDLASKLRELSSYGVRWMVSNADHPAIQELYHGFRADMVQLRHTVGARSRPRVGELIITNYAWEELS